MRIFWPIRRAIMRLARTEIENFLCRDEKYFVRGREVSRHTFEALLRIGMVRGQRNLFKSNRARAAAQGYPDTAQHHGKRY